MRSVAGPPCLPLIVFLAWRLGTEGCTYMKMRRPGDRIGYEEKVGLSVKESQARARFERAMEQLHKILEIDPTYEKAKALLEAIDQD